MSWRDWVRDAEVEPSLYAADFARLGEQVDVLLRAGCRIFHFDVGDGHFVEPVTIGPVVLESIAPLVHEAGGLLDCHLYEQTGRLILHLVNLTNPGAWRPPVHELVPVGPLRVRVQVPEGVVGRSAQLLVAEQTTALSINDGWAEFEVKAILDHEVIVVS